MTNDNTPRKARALGMNHVALEVGDIDQALAFYGDFLAFTLRSRSARAAFIDLGDQFIALSVGRHQAPDTDRHLGLVVDDKWVVRDRLEKTGVALLPGSDVDWLFNHLLPTLPAGLRVHIHDVFLPDDYLFDFGNDLLPPFLHPLNQD